MIFGEGHAMTDVTAEQLVLAPPDPDHPVTRQDIRDGVQLTVHRLLDRRVPGTEREEPIPPAPDGTERTTVVADLVEYDLGTLRVKVREGTAGVFTVTASAAVA